VSDPPPDDAILIARVADGDRQAFAILVTRYHARIHALAWRVTGDAGEAEDAAQDAMLTLWRRADRFEASRGTVAAWLTRIAVNAALDRRRRLRPVHAVDATLAAPPVSDAAPDVVALMATLTPRTRAVVALFYLEEQTMAEIAATLGVSAKAVESILSRARAQLRALVRDDD
jgi:RNA polymerase sigma-70 factor (ECF subfamily)